MSAVFLTSQLDFIFFFYGLAFILLAATCQRLNRWERETLPWKWLGLFGLTHGIDEWLGLIAFSSGDNHVRAVIRLCFMGVSFLCLTEFGRASTLHLSKRAGGASPWWAGWWVYVPLGLFAAATARFGPPGLNAGLRYTFGFVGGLWSAWVLWRSSSRLKTGQRALRVASLCMGFYAFATGLIVPASPMTLASFLNQEAFFKVLGFPIQLLRGTLACAVAAAIMTFAQALIWSDSEDSTVSEGNSFPLWLVLFPLVLMAGWGITETLGRMEHRTFSSVAAVRDPHRQEVPGALVLDLDAKDWKQQVAIHRSIGIGITFLIFMLLIGMFVIHFRTLDATARIAASEKHYRGLFSNLLSGLAYCQAVTDAAGRMDDFIFLEVNPMFEKHAGLSSRDVIGRKFSEVFAGLEKSAFDWMGMFGRIGREGGTMKVEEFFEPLNRWLSVGAYSPRPGYLAVLIEDVSERRRMEKIMSQSEKMAAVGRLASGVAHEINNPLGVILGFAQAGLRRVAPGDALELPLNSIQREALRCSSLVQNLLTFSRTSKGERVPMDLNKAVEGALSLVMAQARIGQVEVKQMLAGDLPLILGNANQIEQIIVNLASNAMDAMGKHGVLSVRTEIQSGQGLPASVCLYVSDTGSGIPAEVLPHIFEPFFTTKSVGQGTGLGLSLVHEIVQKHSGSIDVQSRPGFTEFRVNFPSQPRK